MDLIFWLLLGTALLAVAAILVKLITSQWLKERLRDYLSDRNVDSALVIKRSAVEAMLVEATKNAPRAKLKDLESALKDLENVDLILCSQDKDGEIRKLELYIYNFPSDHNSHYYSLFGRTWKYMRGI